jgi:hypothetical protein
MRVAGIALALAAAAWALAGGRTVDEPAVVPGAPAAVFSAQGDVEMDNERDGEPIMVARKMIPGEPRVGAVQITNLGDPGRYSLRKTDLTGVPGPNGGRLEKVLRLRVRRVCPRCPERYPLEYGGAIKNMPQLALGRWYGSERRRYRFRVRLPDGGPPPAPTTGDNRYQGSRAKVRFIWRVTADD